MKKKYFLIPVALLFAFAIFGCDETGNPVQTADEDITISYNLNGFPGTAPGNYTVKSGEAIGAGALPVLNAQNYLFLGWSATEDGEIIDADASFTGDTTLYARFEIVPLTTKSATDRGGQTIAQLAAAFDNTALDSNVPAIDNIENFSQDYLDNYIRGVDISSILEVERAGGKFYDNDRYHVGDALELLSYYGINWVRIRLWNDPFTADGSSYGAGGNDLDTAIAISRRAKKWGMKILLDFHYSDFWAHPGQQARPKAWLEYSNADQIAAALKHYTRNVLTEMYIHGVLPDMVQIGNETNTGIAGVDGTGADPKKLFTAGLEAAREISAQYNHPIKTMLHATDGMNTIDWWFGTMQELDFDALGLSFYPMWHGNRASFQNGLQNLANKYKKEIVVVEYSVSYTSQAGSPNGSNMYGNSSNDARTFITTGTDRTIGGQAQVIRNLNNDIMNYTQSGGVRYGIGAFWWEPAWLPLSGTGWAAPASSEWYRMNLPGKPADTNNPGSNPRVTWANQAFFSFTGTALPSLNAFLQMMGKPARPPE